MKRAALIRHLLNHGASLRARSALNELYGTAKGEAPIPLRPEIDEYTVVSACRSLAIPIPRGVSVRRRPRIIAKEKIAIEVPPDATVVILPAAGRPKTPRGAGPGRKRKSRG